jgi:hypothetical protein
MMRARHSSTSPMLLELCLLVLLAAPAAPASATQFVVFGDVAMRDSRPIYDVSLPALGASPALLPPSGDGEVVRVVTARGQAMLCGVPAPPLLQPAEEVSTDQEVADGGAVVDDLEGIEELMDEYRGKCFRRSEGWWEYMFCFDSHIEQRHISGGKENDPEVVYVLGEFDPDFDAERRRQRIEASKPGHNRQKPPSLSAPLPDSTPYTQLFGNGTICDVNGTPRTILVKYKCNQDALQVGIGSDVENDARRNFISAVREVETCCYEIEFINSAVCRHPAYKNKLELSTLHINCVLEPGQDQFFGLASTSYQRASLNL